MTSRRGCTSAVASRLHEIEFDADSVGAYGLHMSALLKSASIWALGAAVAVAVSTTTAGVGGGGAPAAGPPPPPPEPQAGHPSGKLVIWGDVASFDVPASLPTHCILMSRFKRGHRMGFRW